MSKMRRWVVYVIFGLSALVVLDKSQSQESGRSASSVVESRQSDRDSQVADGSGITESATRISLY